MHKDFYVTFSTALVQGIADHMHDEVERVHVHEHVCTWMQTSLHMEASKLTYSQSRRCLHNEANEFTSGHECIYTQRQTSLHAEANAFACRSM